MSAPAPRWLRVARDYPRATGALGRPLLEAARLVPLHAGFPRGRCVSDGRAHGWPAWTARTAQHRLKRRCLPPGRAL
ncbi:MAG TPA: hypothetical protein VI248_25980 [Kineosporiaceae bacterium]